MCVYVYIYVCILYIYTHILHIVKLILNGIEIIICLKFFYDFIKLLNIMDIC